VAFCRALRGSGGAGEIAEATDQPAECGEHPLIAFPQQGREDVLADLLAPEVVAAIAAGQAGGVEVHPMGLKTTGDSVPPGAYPVSVQLQTALEAGEIDGHRLEVDGRHGTRNMARNIHSQI